ncbi:polysaccharide biosynthesis tyrosine autokinase [Carboxylicivirga sp. M1479]|uniref:polysaccharide biosynthesis tyrosine autokinase n=1 Tax=Carboxylicivirga sp. M1479 TaxID=2594476 RepID=UPI0011787617|nr:polysaccharide biosynthesis tyrosine autokinase [Carboxylicivirga sp. M1479]TRX66359.1 polysaccharide biosynthesis tyrosine autokinase [Carboxylicivirga sp. M1479]
MNLENDQSNDLKNVLHKVGKHWKLYVISITLFLGIGVLFNKFSEPKVNISAKLVVHESRRNMIDPSSFMPGSELFSGRNTFQNSLISLNARPLLEQVVNKLNIDVFYYQPKVLYDKNLYTSSPFQVVLDKNYLQLTGAEFYVEILSKDLFTLKVEVDEGELHNFLNASSEQLVEDWEFKHTYRFGESIENENFNFTVLLKEGLNIDKLVGKKLFFVIKSNRQVVDESKDNLKIEATQLDATAISINLVSTNFNMGKEFLDKYIETVIEYDLQRKNHIAFSTIDFIDDHLSDVFDSLSIAEQSLQDFKTDQQVVDVNLKAGQIYENLRAIGIEKDQLEAHVNNLEFLNENFQKDEDFSAHSVTLMSNLNNEVLNDLLNEYIGLVGRKQHLLENKQAKSPQLRELTFQISNLKNTILVNLQYELDASRLALQQIRSKISTLNVELNRLPETQRNLTTYERNFRLNDAIYTFLIQKRSEAQIAKASNLPAFELIDYPAFDGRAAPKKSRNLILMVFFGLLLPTIYVLLNESYFEKISDIEDYRFSFKAPVLGQITLCSNGSKKIFEPSNEDAVVAESFRKLRTNLGFWPWKDTLEGRVVLFTSTMPGEGKTFCSYNLAQSLASLGKKTVILDFDLRKGDLSENYFKSENKGISMFLSNQVELDDIIEKQEGKNISYIAAGHLPPNPSELVESDKTLEMLAELKTRYDFIILDAGPTSVTAESLVLGKMADLILVVMRVNYTLKKEFKEIIEELDGSFGKKVTVVLNGVKVSRQRYYNYSAYYAKPNLN